MAKDYNSLDSSDKTQSKGVENKSSYQRGQNNNNNNYRSINNKEDCKRETEGKKENPNSTTNKINKSSSGKRRSDGEMTNAHRSGDVKNSNRNRDDAHEKRLLSCPNNTETASSSTAGKEKNNFFNSHTSLNIIGSMVTLDQANPKGSNGRSLTARQKLYMITIVIAKFIHQLCSFWGAIVYPLEASKRGFSKFQIGTMLVFVSIASWATSIALSTFFLKFGGRRAAFNLFIGGSVSYGLLTIAIAASAVMTDKIMFGLTFTTFFSIRGMGQALLFSSVNTILLSEEFGDQVSFAKALDTLAYTLGSIFSFILSGYLYGQFGFMWVVIILGSLQSCVSLSYIYLLPKKTQDTDGAVDKIAATTNFKIILEVIQNPEILCTLMSHCLVYFTLFYLSPIFTPYVTSQFGLSAILTGMTACLPYLAMSLFGTSWSFVATTRFRRKICVTLPLILFGITSWFSGPDPLITDEASLLTLCLTLFIGGGFLVSNLVLNTPELRDQAEDYGYDTEDIGVSATLASLLTSFEFLGEIVGPPCGGFFGDTFTVRRAFSIGGGFVGVIGVIRVIIYIVRYFTVRERVANLVRTKSSYV